MSDMILSMHSLGKTRIPPENPTDAQIAVYIKDLLALEDGLTVAVRFEIGNTIHDMDIEHGEKFDFCKKNFGEGRAKKVLEYAAIARAWVFNQNVGWSWSYYRELVKATKKDKEDFVKLYKQGRLKSIEQMKELYAELTGKTSEKQAIQDQNPHVGILKQPSSDVIDAEFKHPVPAIAPPSNTVNPGPWCECGEPALPDSQFCLACWKAYRERDVQQHCDPVADFFSPPQPAVQTVSGTSFKVEGKTVQQEEFARPVAVVAPKISTTEPVAVAYNPHTGIITYQACAVRKVQIPQGFAALAILGDGRQVEVFIPCTMMPEEE